MDRRQYSNLAPQCPRAHRANHATAPRPGDTRGARAHAGGALASPAAWEVRRGGVIGRCDTATGLAPFGLLVALVLGQEPYRAAPRVFWVVDNDTAVPFHWRFTRQQLEDRLAALPDLPPPRRPRSLLCNRPLSALSLHRSDE